MPNQQRTLNKLPTELRRGNFCYQASTGHASRWQIVQKHVTHCVHLPTELPFCMPPLVVGYSSFLGSSLAIFTQQFLSHPASLPRVPLGAEVGSGPVLLPRGLRRRQTRHHTEQEVSKRNGRNTWFPNHTHIVFSVNFLHKVGQSICYILDRAHVLFHVSYILDR